VLACEEYEKACGLLVLSIVPAELRRRTQTCELLIRHEVKMLGALAMQLVAFEEPRGGGPDCDTGSCWDAG
jgi:hypothetical protein